MAKRKKRGSKTQPKNPLSSEELGDFRKEQGKAMAAISSALSQQNFSSPEEINRFLSENFTGQKIDEIIASNPLPSTPENEALEILDGIHGSMPFAKQRFLCNKAIQTDPNCVEAFLQLGQMEPKPARAAHYFEKAIAAGKDRFADLIETVPEHGSLYGFHEARPLLHAMRCLAYTSEGQSKWEEAIALYEEILQLNPNDNMGVRYDCISLFLALKRFDAALALISSFEEEDSCHWLFSKALALFAKAESESDYNLSPSSDDEAGDLEILEQKIRNLPTEFDEATKVLEKAVESYPFAPLMISTDEEILSNMEKPMSYRHRSPEEALLYAISDGYIWTSDVILAFWLTDVSAKIIESPSTSKIMEDNAEEIAYYAEILQWGD